MEANRRVFLRVMGLAALGFMVKPLLDVFSGTKTAEAVPAQKELLAGKRWAMAVNIKACLAREGCKECIDACHQVHNVPSLGNAKDEIKWIWKVPYEKAFPEQRYEFIDENLKGAPVIVMCNHCDDPPCVKVCPTQATWKREDGIVMIDYHRCIGCRYCMAGCPYGARSFNWKEPRSFIDEIQPDFPTRVRGVVEKCSFCEKRLSQGLPPACVEACPEKALTFGDLEDQNSEISKVLHSKHILQRLPELGTNPNVHYIT